MMTDRLIGLPMVTGIDAAGTDLNSEIVIDWEPKRAAFVSTQNDGPAPLEQSWAYGDAIATVSSNEIWRGVIDIDGAPVATVQVAERRLPTGLRLVRLTRGPVVAEAQHLTDAVGVIRADYRRWARNLVFWMPDVVDAAPIMRRIGKRPMTTGYTTA
jgi:hypothetical protein